jgi:hypothetical protein
MQKSYTNSTRALSMEMSWQMLRNIYSYFVFLADKTWHYPVVDPQI